MATKVKLLKALVWPVAKHRCASWTLRKANEKRINCFLDEMPEICTVDFMDRKKNKRMGGSVGRHRKTPA